jgi:hypothetical protein
MPNLLLRLGRILRGRGSLRGPRGLLRRVPGRVGARRSHRDRPLLPQRRDLRRRHRFPVLGAGGPTGERVGPLLVQSEVKVFSIDFTFVQHY